MNSVHLTAAPPARHTARMTVFERLARLVVRYRWAVLVGYVVSLVVLGLLGSGVFGAMKSRGFDDPGSESARAGALLATSFGAVEPTAVLAVEAATGVDSPAATAAASTLVGAVSGLDGVDTVASYWTSGRPAQLRSTDGTTGQVLVFAAEDADVQQLAKDLAAQFGGEQDGLTVYVYGWNTVGNALTKTITEDLGKAEGIAVPITVLLLMFVFGSVVAAGLPFMVAGASILGSFTFLFVLTKFTDVSIFALNLVTGLGLALGIDYALLMISRFREELKAGAPTEDAVVTTMRTAGKTVLVSGITVAITLASMLLFPQYFLKSFAYAGVSVSLFAVFGALTALPAMLAILGPNVNRLRVRRGDLAPKDDGAWSRIARTVMRRPWPVMLGAIALLLVMAYPALSVAFGQVDDRALPPSNPAAVAGEVLRDRFPGQESAPYDVVLVDPAGDAAAVDDYAEAISTIPDVVRVTTPTSVVIDGAVVGPNPTPSTFTADGMVRLAVVGDVPPLDAAGVSIVDALRAAPAPAAEVLVGGQAAGYADSNSGILGNVWLVALWIAVTTLIVLFLFTGSVLLPVKALVLNVLSLTATLGALVWVFQGGHLTWLVGDYTNTGTVDISSIALIAVVAFALSMDYELFMLSRIKEEHDAGRNTTDAVAFGLQRTGRIITAAALLIAIVFVSFLSSGVTNIKQLGFGVTVAILVDATIVRALLVPAFMRIAGGANWWAPAPLRRLHDRLGIREG
jgi:putative drug exporter of the RND superfamily